MSSRRLFLRQSGTLLTGAALSPYLAGPSILRRLGTADRLRIAERDAFVSQQWPRIRDHIRLLGLRVEDLLERERA